MEEIVQRLAELQLIHGMAAGKVLFLNPSTVLI